MSTQEATNETQTSDAIRRKRVLQGFIKSDKMDRTVVVTVAHRVKHKEYKKYVVRKVSYMAHDERNEYKTGDIVRIIESRPLSRRKRWRVQSLVDRPA